MKTKAGEGVWQRRCLIDVDGLLFDVRASDKKLPSLFSYLPKALTIIILVTIVTTLSTSVKIIGNICWWHDGQEWETKKGIAWAIISDNIGKMVAAFILVTISSFYGTNRGNNEVSLSLSLSLGKLVNETEEHSPRILLLLFFLHTYNIQIWSPSKITRRGVGGT